MKMVCLQFRNKRDIVLFSEYIGAKLCIVELDKFVMMCELKEEDVDMATSKFHAKVIEQII
jgi:hypothetical protein